MSTKFIYEANINLNILNDTIQGGEIHYKFHEDVDGWYYDEMKWKGGQFKIDLNVNKNTTNLRHVYDWINLPLSQSNWYNDFVKTNYNLATGSFTIKSQEPDDFNSGLFKTHGGAFPSMSTSPYSGRWGFGFGSGSFSVVEYP